MKNIWISALLSTALILVLAACSSTAPGSEAPEGVQPAEEAQQAQPIAEPDGDEKPELPAGVVSIGKYDLNDPITLRYQIDPKDIGIIKTMTFDIRNFGDSTIKPVIIAYVGGASDSSIKRFEYDELPSGYKMIKTEEVNMEVSSLHEINAVKASLRDGLQNDRIIGEHNLNYVAKTAYN